jgi:hypothetical protein
MNDEDLTLYLWEIEEECRYAQRAWREIQSPDADVDTEPWYSIQAFLVAVANISKFLWPTKKGDLTRGKKLRKILTVHDTRPFKSRAMRDSFEHFDERLDTWIALGKGVFYGRVSGTSKSGRFSAHDNVRHFARDTGVLTLLGEEYNLRLIAGEVEKLYQQIRGKTAVLTQ